MERPDMVKVTDILIAAGEFDLSVELAGFVNILESNQPKDGEPYALRAGDFDPERHERQQYDYDDLSTPIRHWVSTPCNPTDDPDYLVVVRNKVREEVKPRFYASGTRVFDYSDPAYQTDADSPEEAQAYADWKNGQES